MDDETLTLNYDCNYNLLLAKRLLRDLTKIQDRRCTISWLRYLMRANKTVMEMQLRNDFLHYLVQNLKEGRLKPPFNDPPSTSSRLADLAHLIPSRIDYSMNADEILSEDEEEEAERDAKPMLMEKSPDGGAFLALQPVPHEGSFCYLAITTRKNSEE